MNKQTFKESYRLARLAKQHQLSTDKVTNYWLVSACLQARDTYKHTDLYCKELVGKYKRHVIAPKGILPA